MAEVWKTQNSHLKRKKSVTVSTVTASELVDAQSVYD